MLNTIFVEDYCEDYQDFFYMAFGRSVYFFADGHTDIKQIYPW